MAGGIMVLTGREKATIFLSILGAETSSRILRYLPDELADLIAAGINHLPSPSPEALAEVLAEFKGFLALPEAGQTTPRLEIRQPPPPRRNYFFLMYERPQMVAFLLALLPEPQRAEALMSLPREKNLVEELLANLKKNNLSGKIEVQIRNQFSDKLFRS